MSLGHSSFAKVHFVDSLHLADPALHGSARGVKHALVSGIETEPLHLCLDRVAGLLSGFCHRFGKQHVRGGQSLT